MTTTCNHPTTRVIQVTGFCFACFTEQRQARRAARRAAIAAHLRTGDTLHETHGDGHVVDWSVDVASGDIWTFHHDSGNHFRAFVPGRMTIDQLAAHLESREDGLGWTLGTYCSECGAPAPVPAPGCVALCEDHQARQPAAC